MKRVIGVIVAMAAVLGFGLGSAAAYPVGGPTVTSDKAVYTAGAPATFTASGFTPGALVTFQIEQTLGAASFSSAAFSPIGTATANASGVASLQTTAPTSVGTYTIRASSADGRFATNSIRVQAPGGGIPETGSNTSSSLQFGALAVGIGAALVAFAGLKRRRPAMA